MTGFNSNLNELIVRFKAIKTGSQQVDFSDALVLGVNAAKGSMQNRIFNQGLDAKGVTLGPYISKQYKKKRQKPPKKQILYKDLEFSGTLRRGIVVIKETPTSVICDHDPPAKCSREF